MTFQLVAPLVRFYYCIMFDIANYLYLKEVCAVDLRETAEFAKKNAQKKKKKIFFFCTKKKCNPTNKSPHLHPLSFLCVST